MLNGLLKNNVENRSGLLRVQMVCGIASLAFYSPSRLLMPAATLLPATKAGRFCNRREVCAAA